MVEQERLNEIAENCHLRLHGASREDALKHIKFAILKYHEEQGDTPEELMDKMMEAPWKMDQFEIFWKQYEKRVARATVLKKFMKLSKTDITAIIDNVRAFVRVHADPTFRPNPLTYLNQRRWEDELPAFGKNRVKAIETTKQNNWTY